MSVTILILIIMSGPRTAITTAEFSNSSACTAAGLAIREELRGHAKVFYGCMAKGPPDR